MSIGQKFDASVEDFSAVFAKKERWGEVSLS
jgi:hypothetical protein